MSKYHPLMPGYKPLGKGSKFRGITERQGDKLVDIKVEIEREGKDSEKPKNGIGVGDLFQLRHFPKITENSQSINELIQIKTKNAQIKDFWVGKGQLTLGISENEELEDFRPKKVLQGFYASIGWTQPEDVKILN